MKSVQRYGLTLVELMVVAGILVVISGFLVPTLARHSATARDTAAKASLTAIRDAIVGTPEKPGYLADTGSLPGKISDLFTNPSLPAFERTTGLGWRGPYLISSGGTYTVNNSAGFTAAYGNNGDPAVLDPWGNSIVLQRPTAGSTAAMNEAFVRLVSAGPNGILNTPADFSGSPYPPASARGDDIVLFVNHSDSPIYP